MQPIQNYRACANRYDAADILYKRCGKSGVLLPKVSLGFWHNFWGEDSYARCREIAHYAFDHGITHFDLANNYGPPPGSAEETWDTFCVTILLLIVTNCLLQLRPDMTCGLDHTEIGGRANI